METKKKDKKKLFVLALFLFAVLVLGGYGVYSYYWTQGNYTTGSPTSETYYNVITIDGSFDPTVTSNISGADTSFLGNGGTLELNCPGTSSGRETIDCTGYVVVNNAGTTDIDVEVLDIDAYAEDTSDSGISVTVGSPSFDWTSARITSSSNRTLYITVPVTINNGTTGGLDSDNPEEVHAPVSGGTISASVDFRLRATQRH